MISMSWYNEKITVFQNKSVADFIDNIINKITQRSQHIDLLYNNFRDESIQDVTQYYFDLLVMDKYIVRFKRNSDASSALTLSVLYSTDNGQTFSSFDNASPAYIYIKLQKDITSPYQINIFLLENNNVCLLCISSWNVPVFSLSYTTNLANNNYKHFLAIKKDNEVLFRSYNNYMSVAEVTRPFYIDTEQFRMINSINVPFVDNAQYSIFYSPKIIKKTSDGNFKLICTDDILDCSYVPTYARMTINNHKYFAYNNYTLIKYED